MELAVQLEHPLPEGGRFQVLQPRELERYALALARCWRLAGLRRGDRVVIMDFGSSPVSYLASSMYTPFLRLGAAERTGCIPACNDGVATVVQRGVHLMRALNARAVYVRNDLVMPLLGAWAPSGAPPPAVIACGEESLLTPAEAEQFRDRTGVVPLRLLRLDAALFLSQECPVCRAFHVCRDLYAVWEADGALGVAPRFSPGRACVTHLPLRRARGRCPVSPRDLRLVISV